MTPLQRRLAGCLALAMIVVTATGCNDPAYHATMAVRLERLRDLDRQIAKSEQRRPGNLQELGNTVEEQSDFHHRRLVRTLEFVDARYAANIQRWFDLEPQRAEYIARLWNGRTERSPAAFGALVY